MKYIPELRSGEEMQDIFSSAIPLSIPETACGLGNPLSEIELRRYFGMLAQANEGSRMLSFLGGGAYDHYIPSIVPALAGRSEFLTSYTQYQPELSQGMLQALFEYQTMVAGLFNMDVVNSSMYDGASALAEAVLMASRICGGEKNRVLVSSRINPLARKVVETYCIKGSNLLLEELPGRGDGATSLDVISSLPIENNVSSAVFQNPNMLGIIEDLNDIAAELQKRSILFILSQYPISLGVLQAPGELGADIAVGDAQCLGLPLGFGGPYSGIFAAKEEHMRQMPGRLVGETVDAEGKRAYTLTLSTREQHIRRGQATSNICTNQALCALASAVYCATMGKEGIREVAQDSMDKAHYLAREIFGKKHFWLRYNAPFFNEFLVETNLPIERVQEALERRNIQALFNHPLYPIQKNTFLVAVTEKKTKEELDFFAHALQEVGDEIDPV